MLVASVVVPVVVASVGLYQWMSSGREPGLESRDADLDVHSRQSRSPPVDEPVGTRSRVDAAEAKTSAPRCSDALDLSGRWLATTTVAGAIRRVRSVNGRYTFEFEEVECETWVTIEKTGYEGTVFEPEKVQRGRARVEPAGGWGAHQALEVRVSLSREGSGQAIHRLFRFIRVDDDTVVGEWRQVDDAWDKHGMWGYFEARRGVASHPRGDDREGLPCVLQCRLGCDALRRQADGLEPHGELERCGTTCMGGDVRGELCSEPGGFSISTESIGELHLGMTIAEVHATIGPPMDASRPSFEHATGDTVTRWRYPREGVTLEVSLGRAPGSGTLRSISVRHPSRRVTAKGVGIGTEVDAVRRAYGRALDAEMTSAQRLVVGSIFGGLILDVRDGRVQRMFLGAAAE